jgi:hypothetical protein
MKDGSFWVRFVLLAGLTCVAGACTGEDVVDQEAPQSVEHPDVPQGIPDGLSLYRNERFDFVVAYPDTLLIPVDTSDNRAGRRFVSADSSVVLAAFGRSLSPDDSAASVFDRRILKRQEESGLIIHAREDDSSFVLSGASGERIYYEKSVVYAGRIATFELTYPIRMKPSLDSLAARMADRFGPRR